MANTLASPDVAGLLSRLYAEADARDPDILARIQKEAESRFGGRRYVPELAPLFDQAYLPVPADVGRLLYVTIRTKRPRTVVEVGTSFGISAIHIAAALNDNGEGRLISAELSARKSDAARKNLEKVELEQWVDIREGDAFETLSDVPEIDVLFLDGWKDFYLPLLRRLEPKLAKGALVIGDDTRLFPDRLADYLAYVREPSRFQSVEIAIGDGVELSVRV